MKNGQKSSLYGETSLYSEEIPYSELFSKIHYIEYPLYYENAKTWCFERLILWAALEISIMNINLKNQLKQYEKHEKRPFPLYKGEMTISPLQGGKDHFPLVSEMFRRNICLYKGEKIFSPKKP